MRKTLPRIGASSRTTPVAERLAALLVVAFFVAVLIGVLGAGLQIGDLTRRHDDTIRSRLVRAERTDDVGNALRRLRTALHRGERFALVFSPGASAGDSEFFRQLARLLALSEFYPAIATDDLQDADVAIVVGKPPLRVRRGFDEVQSVRGLWLGRRRR